MKLGISLWLQKSKGVHEMGRALSKKVLSCPKCYSQKLNEAVSELVCDDCNFVLRKSGSTLRLIETNVEDSNDFLDRIKNHFRKNRSLFTLLTNIVSPTYKRHGELDLFLKKYVTEESIAMNLGCGCWDISPNVTNIDLFHYPTVDVVCSIDELPVLENSVDVIILLSVLEHVPDSKALLDEIFRVLRPGGRLYATIPFIQTYHAAPHDYMRYTKSGVEKALKLYDIEELKCFGGPTSALIWVVQEWLSIVLSFNNSKLHHMIHIFLIATLWPLKYLDFIFIKFRHAENMSAGFQVIAKK